ncbi:hypothetical protein ABIF66_002945 [Bradyrhizobium japonicum]
MKGRREILDRCRNAEAARTKQRNTTFGQRRQVLESYQASWVDDRLEFKCSNCGATVWMKTDGIVWDRRKDCPTTIAIIEELHDRSA